MSLKNEDRNVEVAVFAPVRNTLTYAVPVALADRISVGSRVSVPLGSRQAVGVVLGPARSAAPPEIRPVADVLDTEPIFEAELLAFLQWVAGYYMAPPGEVLRAALPAGLHAPQKEVLRLSEAGARALTAHRAILRLSDEKPLSAQALALLERVERSRRGISRRGLPAALLARLLDRGLLVQTMRRQPNKTRTDILLELVEGALAERSLARAPKQAAVVAALRQAGGRARLGELGGAPPGCRDAVQRLAAKGMLRIEVVEVPRDPFAVEPVEPDRCHELTEEQRGALDALLVAVGREGYAGFLLHGVTGSGKTEVYLRLIAEILPGGRTALVLVPEISLTPQLAARFRARFGNQVAVLHSALTDAARYDQWRLIRAGQVKIVVGARSAIFAPLARIGVVIVDEEHDGSFKQEEGVRYNARDLALLRAKRAGAVAVLGSATPALESRQGAASGRLQLLTMRHRATPRPLPEVEVIDLRSYRTGPDRVLSAPLAQALEQTLRRGEQAILFLNRRGFAPFVICRGCGHVFSCQHCSVSLTHHQGRDRLICHYCGYAEARPRTCPGCQREDSVGLLGLGTERVEEHLRQRYPEARIARLDRDTASEKGMRAILARVARREIDILVGTQMVTKGHDFPQVTLVGVVCADLGLHFPDFRAGERTFQLLTQVAGRAGRGERSGRVLVQTLSIDHPSILRAQDHDYEAFFREEVAARRELGYPPWAHLAAVRIDGREAETVERRARALADRARRAATGTPVNVLGPAAAPLQKLKGRVRWLLLVKSPQRGVLRQVLDGLELEQGGVRVTVDIDPLNLL